MMMLRRRGNNGNQGIRGNIRGGDRRGRKMQGVEWTKAIVPSDHAPGGKGG
jgi:hypothetical protein